MITKDDIKMFANYLWQEEKSEATVEKYIRDVTAFARFLGERELCKQEFSKYKSMIKESYAISSVSSMIISINCFLKYIGRADCCVKGVKSQRQLFLNEGRELSTADYKRLLKCAEGRRISLVMRTICETGIRVSELKYITVEAVRKGRAEILCKGKHRTVFITSSLRSMLLSYTKKSGIKAGSVFVTKGGQPLNRSNIWRDMKELCEKAGVEKTKVFPHNLRHLFARTFYRLEHDIVRLADVLGHSSINTTRIYTAESGREHIICLERVNKALIT